MNLSIILEIRCKTMKLRTYFISLQIIICSIVFFCTCLKGNYACQQSKDKKNLINYHLLLLPPPPKKQHRLNYYRPVGLGCRIHHQHLCRRVRPHQQVFSV